jgi:hypothetical protein
MSHLCPVLEVFLFLSSKPHYSVGLEKGWVFFIIRKKADKPYLWGLLGDAGR